MAALIPVVAMHRLRMRISSWDSRIELFDDTGCRMARVGAARRRAHRRVHRRNPELPTISESGESLITTQMSSRTLTEREPPLMTAAGPDSA